MFTDDKNDIPADCNLPIMVDSVILYHINFIRHYIMQ